MKRQSRSRQTDATGIGGTEWVDGRRQNKETHKDDGVHHWKADRPAGRSSAAWARPWHCRSWTRWCPAGRRSKSALAATAERTRLVCIEEVHGLAGCNNWGASKYLFAPETTGRDFTLVPDNPLKRARAVPRLPDHHQQHRRADGRGVRAARDRRRPLPLERGVPHAVAPEADQGLRPLGGDVARSAVRASASARARRCRRCSSASRTSIRPAAAPTTTRAPTPTRSAGRRRTSRCR